MKMPGLRYRIFAYNRFCSNQGEWDAYQEPIGQISQNEYTEAEDYENEPPLLEGIF